MGMLLDGGVLEVAEPVDGGRGGLEDFFALVGQAEKSALLLDFDGTLAPFRVDPMRARPWAGVRELVARIHDSGRTRVVIVTGRPARHVMELMGLPFLEIWGLHGAERLTADGRIEADTLRPYEQEALDELRRSIAAGVLGRDVRMEEKWNAVVVHWRGKPARVAATLLEGSLKLMTPVADQMGMQLIEFDGGVELRAGRHKGDAVTSIVDEMPCGAPVAYLGDDTTDEDAFRALARRGLTVLVRRERRATAAKHWLRPPGELRAFLRDWAEALED